VKIKHRTLDALVVDELRQRIISGSLPAGSRIDQQALAEELDVSRMPIREALRRLAAEGFVDLVSHRGATVVDFSADDIRELYQIRAVLQALASRLSVPNFTEDDMSKVRHTLELMKSEDCTVERWIELNRIFHESIEGPSNASHLLAMIRRLTEQCAPYMQIAALTYLRAPGSTEMQTIHDEIFDALVAGDAKRLEAAIQVHLLETGGKVERFVRQNSLQGNDAS
jgi:DNA-binding GntR family transcriptional regulator